MEAFMRGVLIAAATILIVAMRFFLTDRVITSMTALKVSAFALGAGSAAAFISAVYVSRFGNSLFIGLTGFAVIFVVVFYLIPSILMLNLTLYAAVFHDVTDNLKGKLKIWTAFSLISFSVFLYYYLFNNVTYGLANDISALLGWLFIILMYIAFAFWFLGALFMPFVMFICALKTTETRIKRKWLITAFFCPIAGSLLYLLMNHNKKLLEE